MSYRTRIATHSVASPIFQMLMYGMKSVGASSEIEVVYIDLIFRLSVLYGARFSSDIHHHTAAEVCPQDV